MVKRKKYLDEIVKIKGETFTSNNLIKSPVGSGKTYFILNTLRDKNKDELMLVSTTSLKDSMSKIKGVYTTADIDNSSKLKGANIHLMTYAELGERIKFSDSFVEKFDTIYCDEIHSLFEYFSYRRDYKLGAVIKYLFMKHEGQDKYYFTATVDRIREFSEKNKDVNIMRHVNVIDYSDEEDIVGHSNMMKYEFGDVEGIMDVIDFLEDFGANGEKGLIYNERIDGMKKIEGMLKIKGYTSISIWSINNKDNKMSDEQLRVREELLVTGIIPDGYDFVIINGAMREGWNLLDENVELVILNTRDVTSMIQSRGRVRKDIAFLAYRVEGEVTPIDIRILRRERSLGIIEESLGKPLSTKDKKELYTKLSVKRDNGVLVKWPTIKEALESNGYNIEDKTVRENGKRYSASIITRN